MDTRNTLLNLSVSQLKRAADLKERIDALNDELAAILGGTLSSADQEASAPGKRRMSAAGRRRIAEAARARWAKLKANGGGAASAGPATGGAKVKKRTMSPEARRKIAEAARARWARVRAAKGK